MLVVLLFVSSFHFFFGLDKSLVDELLSLLLVDAIDLSSHLSKVDISLRSTLCYLLGFLKFFLQTLLLFDVLLHLLMRKRHLSLNFGFFSQRHHLDVSAAFLLVLSSNSCWNVQETILIVDVNFFHRVLSHLLA